MRIALVLILLLGFLTAALVGSWDVAKLTLLIIVLTLLGVPVVWVVARKEDRRFLLWLFALGFGLRLAAGAVILWIIPDLVRGDPYLSFGFLGDDGIGYDLFATRALEVWNSGHNPLDALPTQAKGYILLDTVIYKVMGHELYAVRVVNAFIGALMPLFVYGIARSFLPRGYARLAAGLAAVYPGHVIYAGSHLKDTSVTTAFIAGLWAITSPGRFTSRRTLVSLGVLLIVCVAYLASTRAYYAGVVPAALVIATVGMPLLRGIRKRQFYRLPMAIGLLVLLLVVVQFVLDQLRYTALWPIDEAFSTATSFYAGVIRPAGTDSFYTLVQPPFNAILLPVGIVFTLLNPFLLWPLVNPTPIYTVLSPAIAAWYLLMPFGLYGLVKAWRDSRGGTLVMVIVLVFIILAVSGSGLVTTGRTKLPLEPLWLIFAAIGLKHFMEGRKTIRAFTLVYGFFIVFIIFAYLWVKEPAIFRSFIVGISLTALVAIPWLQATRRIRIGQGLKRLLSR